MADRTTPAGLEGPRPARPEERSAILDMLNFVFRIAAGRQPTIESDWAHVYALDNLENVLIVTEGGKVVASVGVWSSDVRLGDVRLRVGGINCVGTLPEYRRHGLGKGIMEAAHQHMRDLGCQVGLLSTNITNWYRRLGWERAGAARTYCIDRGNIGLLPRLPDGVRWREAGKETAGAIVRLHHADQLGAVRTPEQFLRMLTTRANARILVAERDGKPAAYLLVRGANVFEWAGPATSVAGLVRACFEELDEPSVSTSARDHAFKPLSLRELTLAAPARGHPLLDLLDGLRIPVHHDYIGMMLVLDPRGLLDAFGYRSIRVDEEHDGFRLGRGNSSVVLNRNQLTKLLLGPERISDFADDVFPLPFWQWEVDRV